MGKASHLLACLRRKQEAILCVLAPQLPLRVPLPNLLPQLEKSSVLETQDSNLRLFN